MLISFGDEWVIHNTTIHDAKERGEGADKKRFNYYDYDYDYDYDYYYYYYYYYYYSMRSTTINNINFSVR